MLKALPPTLVRLSWSYLHAGESEFLRRHGDLDDELKHAFSGLPVHEKMSEDRILRRVIRERWIDALNILLPVSDVSRVFIHAAGAGWISLMYYVRELGVDCYTLALSAATANA